MIEIRELVIRATVEDTSRSNNGSNTTTDTNQGNGNKKECCSETVDMLLQMINDKKER